MTTEQRINALEKSVRRQRIINTALLLVVVVMATMAAAPQSKDATFDTIWAKALYVTDDAGETTALGGGVLSISDAEGGILAMLHSDEDGGKLGIFNPAGEPQTYLGAGENGGVLSISNKTGESVVQAYADEYGNGIVGAYNRKGKGRILKPGPN